MSYKNFTSYLSQHDKGMTSAELAAKVSAYLGVSVSSTTIEKIKAGKYPPTVVLALGLAKVLHTSVENLFDIEGSE